MTTNDQLEERMLRLRWACRRVNKALDGPLSQFLSQHYPQQPMGRQFAFERLLSAADQDIFDWLNQRRLPRDQGILEILALIRDMPPP